MPATIFDIIEESNKELHSLDDVFKRFDTDFNYLEKKRLNILEQILYEELFLTNYDLHNLSPDPSSVFTIISPLLINTIQKLADSLIEAKSKCGQGLISRIETSLHEHCIVAIRIASSSTYHLLNSIYPIIRQSCPVQARILQNTILSYRSSQLANVIQLQIDSKGHSVNELYQLIQIYERIIEDDTTNYGEIIPIDECIHDTKQKILLYASEISKQLIITPTMWKDAILHLKTSQCFRTLSKCDEAYSFWRLNNIFGELLSDNFVNFSFTLTSLSLYSTGGYAFIQSALVDWMKTASRFSFDAAFTSLITSISSVHSCSSSYLCREFGKKVMYHVKLNICSAILQDLDEKLTDEQRSSLSIMIKGFSEQLESK